MVVPPERAPTWSLLGDALATVNLFAFTAYLASKRIRRDNRGDEGRLSVWRRCLRNSTTSVRHRRRRRDLGSPSRRTGCFSPRTRTFPAFGPYAHQLAHAHVPPSSRRRSCAVPVIATAGARRHRRAGVGPAGLGAAVVLAAVGITVASARRASMRLELAESLAEKDDVDPEWPFHIRVHAVSAVSRTCATVHGHAGT
jgi:hypothetical protein